MGARAGDGRLERGDLGFGAGAGVKDSGKPRRNSKAPARLSRLRSTVTRKRDASTRSTRQTVSISTANQASFEQRRYNFLI